VISEGPFDYRKVNIAAQRDAPGSLMEHMQRLIRTRRACPEIGWGDCTVLPTPESGVLALHCAWRGQSVLTLHNLSDRRVDVRLSADGLPESLTPLFCDDGQRNPCPTDEPIALGSYGFRWFRADGERR